METIYKVVNPKREVYVGSTNNLTRRIKEHKSRALNAFNGLVYDSFRKYGFDNHKFIEICEVEPENRMELEHFIIQEFEPELNMVSRYNATATGKIWVNDGENEFQIYECDFKPEYSKGRLENSSFRDALIKANTGRKRSKAEKTSRAKYLYSYMGSEWMINEDIIAKFDVSYHQLYDAFRGRNKDMAKKLKRKLTT